MCFFNFKNYWKINLKYTSQSRNSFTLKQKIMLEICVIIDFVVPENNLFYLLKKNR